MANKKVKIELSSFDSLATFELGEIRVMGKPYNDTHFKYICFSTDSGNVLELVESKAQVLYTETLNYDEKLYVVLHDDYHYVLEISDSSNTYWIYNMYLECSGTNGGLFYFPFPILSTRQDNIVLSEDGSNTILWDEIIYVNDFDMLVEFYSRINTQYSVEIDNDSRKIKLYSSKKIYLNKLEIVNDFKVEIVCDENGVTLLAEDINNA
jgi:hypothetical protein